MNNEPVAWMTFDGEYSYELMIVNGNEDYRNEYIKRNGEKYKDWVQPLYTHPVKEHFEDEPQAEELHEILQSNLELTDEEIDDIAKKCDEDEDQGKTIEFWYRNFARAILRKAQEK